MAPSILGAASTCALPSKGCYKEFVSLGFFSLFMLCVLWIPTIMLLSSSPLLRIVPGDVGGIQTK